MDHSCRDVLIPDIPYTYLQQVADLDLAAEWKRLDLPLLIIIIYGTSDPATTIDESKYLMNMVHSFHPGRASYLEIPGMGHNLTVSPLAWAILARPRRRAPAIAPGVAACDRGVAERTRTTLSTGCLMLHLCRV
jgi:pimeloyl-ACP methyl ester carboxylesterase